MLVLNILVLLIALYLIIKFSDIFVDAATSLAQCFKVSKMVLSLTVAAFSTCAPELAISFNSISSGNVDMTLANVIGSCVINILFIIGVAAIVKPIKLRGRTVRRELPLLLLITTAFFFLMNDSFYKNSLNNLSRVDGIILIILFIIFCLYIVSITRKHREDIKSNPLYTKKQSIIMIVCSVIGIVVSSDLIVDSAVFIAESLHVSQKFIAMTVIVVGTSLPELTITVLSAKKGEFDMAIGNIIGTNIFNICVVLGLPVTIFGAVYSSSFNLIDLMVVLLAALLLSIFGTSNRELSRREGIAMLLVVIVYYLYLFIM